MRTICNTEAPPLANGLLDWFEFNPNRPAHLRLPWNHGGHRNGAPEWAMAGEPCRSSSPSRSPQLCLGCPAQPPRGFAGNPAERSATASMPSVPSASTRQPIVFLGGFLISPEAMADGGAAGAAEPSARKTGGGSLVEGPGWRALLQSAAAVGAAVGAAATA